MDKDTGECSSVGSKVKVEIESGDSTDTMDFSDTEVQASQVDEKGIMELPKVLDGENPLESPSVKEDGSILEKKEFLETPEKTAPKQDIKQEPESHTGEHRSRCNSSLTKHPEPPVQAPGTPDKKRVAGGLSRSRSARDASSLPQVPGIVWRVGAKLEAKDFQNKWYTAKILEIDAMDDTVLIHFDGWNSRYDEWVPTTSERLRSLSRHSERKETRSKASPKADYKLGQCVFAKWTDCRMYPGKILNINSNGSCEVLFYDGFKKTVQGINIKTMPPEVKQQYAKAGLLPEPGKKNKFPIREIAKEIQEKISAEESFEEKPQASTGSAEKRRKSSDNTIASKRTRRDSSGPAVSDVKRERRSSREGRRKDSADRKESSRLKASKEKASPHCLVKKEGEKTPKSGGTKTPLASPGGDGGVVTPEAEVYRCPFSMCTKSFRKQNNVDNHVKYFHTPDGTPVQPPTSRKRTKTTSVCSEDSEVSLSAGRTGGRRKRKSERASLEYQPPPVHDDDVISNADTKTTTTEDYQAELCQTELSHFEEGEADESVMDRIEKDEVVNCICQINEENGLMIQCDVCLCWQHALCMELTEETLPAKYMCVVCQNPPGVRESARFSYDQDWLKLGTPHSLSFLPPEGARTTQEKARAMQMTHSLVADIHNVGRVLKSSQLQLHALKERNGSELAVWMTIADRKKNLVMTPNIKSLIGSEETLKDLDTAGESSSEIKKSKDGTDPNSPESTHSDSTVSAVEEPPASGEEQLLQCVDSMHDSIETRLDFIEQQLTKLEDTEDKKCGSTALNKAGNLRNEDLSLPRVKKSLHHLISDLNKVKRLSLYHP